MLATRPSGLCQSALTTMMTMMMAVADGLAPACKLQSLKQHFIVNNVIERGSRVAYRSPCLGARASDQKL